MCSFLTMGSPDGGGLSQLYLELVNAYKNRFTPKSGQVTVLKSPPIWKKMIKGFKTLFELKLKFIPRAWKREPLADKTIYSQNQKTRDSLVIIRDEA